MDTLNTYSQHVKLSVVKCHMHKVITFDSVAVFHMEAMVLGRE